MTSPGTAGEGGAAWGHRTSRPFLIIGALGVVGGGLVSAGTAGSPSYHASWAVAYLVLVVGVAQIALGVAQASLTRGTVPGRVVAGEAVSWNLGNALVLLGTLAGTPALLYVGAVLLVVALLLFAVAIRRGRRGVLLAATWALIVILLISMPVGVVIQAVAG